MSREIGEISIEPEVDLLIDFVNTRDIEAKTDEISGPAELEAWIRDHDSGPGEAEVEPEGQQRILALRESLRALLRANNGGEAGEGELAPLTAAAGRSRYRATFSTDGRLGIDPDGSGLGAFEARLLLAIERVQASGAWPRLKACPTDDCQWAFFDSSRNHSRTWCSMEVCGNREKTRRYRSRKWSD